jgi:hypothetical protein
MAFVFRRRDATRRGCINTPLMRRAGEKQKQEIGGAAVTINMAPLTGFQRAANTCQRKVIPPREKEVTPRQRQVTARQKVVNRRWKVVSRREKVFKW